MSDDLVTWLRVQLDADEQDARYEVAADMASDAGWAPHRALREVEAKRRIVDGHLQIVDSTWPEPGHCLYCWDSAAEDYRPWPCDTLRILALPYSDRPGYREEWRP